MVRYCKKCLTTKDISNFYRNKHACRECLTKIRTKWRKDNPGREKITYTKYRRDNKEKVKNSQLKCKFGITTEQRKEMLKKQDEKCIICGNTETFTGTLCIDHDHETGKIRGLLCSRCNVGIGNLYDDPFFLAKAIDYLKFGI